jgi:hypothetical protein
MMGAKPACIIKVILFTSLQTHTNNGGYPYYITL